MTVSTAKNGTLSRQVIRAGTLSTLCAAVLAGLVATPAQAADEWTVTGPIRSSVDAALKDVPAAQDRCRRRDGIVGISGAWSAAETGSGRTIWYAFANCRAKRVISS